MKPKRRPPANARESDRIGSVLAGVFLLSLIAFVVDWGTGFKLALLPLYAVPVWFGARFDIRRAAVLAVVLATFAGAMRGGLHPWSSAVAAQAAVQLLGWTAFATVIAVAEASFVDLRRLAFCDPLTGLLNRRALARSSSKARPRDSVVVMIDCDGFKSVNDRYGHHAGDHILRILGRVLKHETRDVDMAVRMGGDEFALILSGVDPSEAENVLERIQQRFERQVIDAGYECCISAGIAQADPSMELEQLLRVADEAMYRQKRMKRAASAL